MKRLLGAAVLAGSLLVLAGCGGGDPAVETPATDAASDPAPAEPTDTAEAPAAAGGVSSSASCILAIEYDGRLYVGSTLQDPPATGESLGEGFFPPCDDTGTASSEAPDPVEVFALEGVDPQDAVAVAGREEIFVAEGVDPATLTGD